MASSSELDDTKYTLLEHLSELRGRLVKSILAIFLTTGVALYFASDLLEITVRPLKSVLHDRNRVEAVLIHADSKRAEVLEGLLGANEDVHFDGRMKDLNAVRQLAEGQIKQEHPLDLVLVSAETIKDDGALVSDLLEGLKPQPEVVYLVADPKGPAVSELQLEGASLIPDPPRKAALARVVRRAAAASGKTSATGDKLVVLSPLEPIFAYLKIALVIGLFLACPVWLYQAWQFVAPGLYRREKMIVLPFVLSASFLFLAGGLFAYFVMFPVMFNVLVNEMMPASLAGAFTVDKYLSLLLTMTVAFGVVFELPLVIAVLAMIGLVTPSMLRSFRKYAIIGNFIFAAVITPTTDPLSLFMMAIPMCLFYELGILLAVLMQKKTEARLRAAEVNAMVVQEPGGLDPRPPG
jgi:sec-independent protein translocase protein TatC